MGEAAAGRYRAFISYSHVDQAFGRRLHRRLERYALPRRLVGRETPRGPVPRRVAPVFRDREEFSAAGDLTAEVRAALAASASLIVVCSPAAAASPWVGREVELFRELHPDRPVLAVVAAGEPAECFPKALTVAGGATVEPLAADFRPHADGRRLGLLKLVAGVVGVGLDELVQRDAQRRLVAVTAVTSGAVAVALAMTALTAFAVLAQREAERQRGQAEALVEFMLTDLRDRLKGVGRLDVLTTVNERTLKYYADQEIEELPPASQARYARILMAMGEDDMTRGDAGPALEKFTVAEAITERLLADAPEDPQRMWSHGQSEYWIGYSDFLRQDRASAAARWQEYRRLSQRLVDRMPSRSEYHRELAYAEGNLCTLALAKPVDGVHAVASCVVALREMEAAARLSARPEQFAADLINRHAWLADAHLANGDVASAYRQRLMEERLLSGQIVADPLNQDLKETWIILQRALASIEIKLDRRRQAKIRLSSARAAASELLYHDPENGDWIRLYNRVNSAIKYVDENKGER